MHTSDRRTQRRERRNSSNMMHWVNSTVRYLGHTFHGCIPALSSTKLCLSYEHARDAQANQKRRMGTHT
jgi:hypothetical protein